MPFRLLCVLGCILMLVASCSQDEISKENSKRNYNQELLDKAAENENYNYSRAIVHKENPFFKYLIPVLNFVSKIFGSWIGYAVLIGLLILMIIYLIKIGKNNQVTDVQINKSGSVITVGKEEIDLSEYSYESLEDLVKAALKNEDYRSAIRYSFLSAIYFLNDKEIIELHAEKTNSEYQAELPPELKSKFGYISTISDWVLYGEYKVNESVWNLFYSERVKLIKGHE